jgi:hypothetical protein
MITDKTVFILGAGASNPYGYPTGNELREKICKEFTKKGSYFKPNDIYKQNLLRIAKQFTDRFHKAGAQTSIDLFLKRLTPDEQNKFTNIGKTAISFFILEAECASKFDEYMEEEKRKHDWYAPLLNKMMQKLTTHDSYEKLGDNAITFITFNYDRSLEYYIHKCFTNNFPDAPKEYIKKIGDEIIKIHHVYGKIADLPWQNPGGYFQQYGPNNFAVYVEDTIRNIKTIYEMTEDIKEDIKKSIAEAKQIFFLGFGYAEENLEAIGMPDVLKDDSRAKRIYGTAKGLSQNRMRELKTRFAPYAREENIKIEDRDCLSLLNQYLL